MPHDALVWCMFFSSIVSMNEHPGFLREGCAPLSLRQCAARADEMLALYLERGGVLWPVGPQ